MLIAETGGGTLTSKLFFFLVDIPVPTCWRYLPSVSNNLRQSPTGTKTSLFRTISSQRPARPGQSYRVEMIVSSPFAIIFAVSSKQILSYLIHSRLILAWRNVLFPRSSYGARSRVVQIDRQDGGFLWPGRVGPEPSVEPGALTLAHHSLIATDSGTNALGPPRKEKEKASFDYTRCHQLRFLSLSRDITARFGEC